MWAEAEGLSTPCLPCRGEIRLISMTEHLRLPIQTADASIASPHIAGVWGSNALSAHTPLARDKGSGVLQYVLAEHMKNF